MMSCKWFGGLIKGFVLATFKMTSTTNVSDLKKIGFGGQWIPKGKLVLGASMVVPLGSDTEYLPKHLFSFEGGDCDIGCSLFFYFKAGLVL